MSVVRHQCANVAASHREPSRIPEAQRTRGTPVWAGGDSAAQGNPSGKLHLEPTRRGVIDLNE